MRVYEILHKVKQIGAVFGGIVDKSIKFCTQLGNVIRKIFGYTSLIGPVKKKWHPFFKMAAKDF